MDRNFALGIVSGVTLLVGGVETSHATMVTHTDTINVPATDTADGSQTLDFPMFNPVLGMLTGVTFDLTSSTSTSIVFDTTSFEGATIDGSNATTFKVSITTPNLGQLFPDSSSTAMTSCNINSQAGCSAPEVTVTASFDGNGAVGLPSDYVGTGMVEATLAYANNSNFDFNGGLVGNFSSTASLTWNGNLAITYTYDPAGVVPEPSSMLLLGTGLAGLGIFRRRKQA